MWIISYINIIAPRNCYNNCLIYSLLLSWTIKQNNIGKLITILESNGYNNLFATLLVYSIQSPGSSQEPQQRLKVIILFFCNYRQTHFYYFDLFIVSAINFVSAGRPKKLNILQNDSFL